MVSSCIQPSVYGQLFGGLKSSFDRGSFDSLLIYKDYLIVILFLFFISYLKQQQDNYIKAFEKKQIEINKYAVRIEDLPFLEEGY